MFYRTVTLSILLCAALFTAASAQNLLRNPSFEAVPDNTMVQGILPSEWIQASTIDPGADTWSTDGSYGVVPGDFGRFVGVSAQDGNRWVAGGANPAYIEPFGQQLTAPLMPFAAYEFTAYVQQDNSRSNAPGGYDVYLSPTQFADDPMAVRVGRLAATTGANWEARNLIFNAPACAGTLTYFLLVPYCISAGAEAYPGIDNVALTAVTSVGDVSGTIALQDCNDPEQAITFEFRPMGGGMPFKIKQMLIQNGADSGTYHLTGIPAGTYDIAIKGYCWLQKVLPNVAVTGSVSGMDATLINADINNDNVIDLADFGILVNGFGSIGDL